VAVRRPDFPLTTKRLRQGIEETVMSKVGRLSALALALAAATPGNAFLYWTHPAFTGTPVTGDEPGIALPLLNANPKEKLANLVWSMRAGLNVAALQCQFAPILHTVDNYNVMLRQHGDELKATQATLFAYFKRTTGKTWQTAFDQYTTRTYNGFSTMHAQMGFCETAADIGRDVLSRRAGQLNLVATTRMRELRNSLVPIGDAGLVMGSYSAMLPAPMVIPVCYDKKGREKACKVPKAS
jgi:hypothetical protein